MSNAPKAKHIMIKIVIKGGTYDAFRDAIGAIAEHYNIMCIDPFDDEFFFISFI